MRQTIRVTAEDILKARRMKPSCFTGPLANALTRLTGEKWGINEQGYAYSHSTGNILLPPDARRFLYRYDDTGKAQPFEFSLELERPILDVHAHRAPAQALPLNRDIEAPTEEVA